MMGVMAPEALLAAKQTVTGNQSGDERAGGHLHAHRLECFNAGQALALCFLTQVPQQLGQPLLRPCRKDRVQLVVVPATACWTVTHTHNRHLHA